MGTKGKESQESINSMGLGDLTRCISVVDMQKRDDGDPEILAENHYYDDDIQLQEAILSSMRLCNKRKQNSHQDLELEAPVIKQKGICWASCKVEPHVDESEIRPKANERGEASWSVCVICGDEEPTGKVKRLFQCHHALCEDCLSAYVGKTIQKNIYEEVACPAKKCKETRTAEQCVSYLPPEVDDRWFEATREASVLASPKFIRCPFEDCWGLFLDDERCFLIRACPNCWRIFCMKCRVRWPMGLNCRQFQALQKAKTSTLLLRDMYGP